MSLQNPQSVIRSRVQAALSSLHAGLDVSSSDITIERPANPEHGDYSTNIAMQLFSQSRSSGLKAVPTTAQKAVQKTSKKTVSQKTHSSVTTPALPYDSPAQLAKDIIAQLSIATDADRIFSQISLAGPGFINFSLSPQYLISQLAQDIALRDPRNHGQKVVVEYSSPNIAKPFTIGHLPSTIIGDTVANLFEALGWDVYRDNHLGDWGTQFGKEIVAILKYSSEKALDRDPHPVKTLVDLYIRFHEEATQDPALEDEARLWFRKLETHDPEARRIWQKCIDWSLKEFREVYEILGIKFTENGGLGYGESFFEDKMDEVLSELKEKGIAKESEDALLVFFPNDELPPLMVQKKDGATLYATRDLATDKFRLQHYGQDVLVINEIGAEQSLYFKQIFRTEELLGWYKKGKRVHVKHGLYRFKEGKMSTRKGNVIWLRDVLQEAFERTSQIAQAAKVQNQESQTAAAKESEIWKVAVGALKWNGLKKDTIKDVIFDWDEVLSVQGNSGPYIQYVYARCRAIERNFQSSDMGKKMGQNIAATKLDSSSFDVSKAANAPKSSHTPKIDSDLSLAPEFELNPYFQLNPEEKMLLRLLVQYSDAVSRAAQEYAPHHLCTFLFSLAQQYNLFYAKHSVLQPTDVADTQQTIAFRLQLTRRVAQVLQHGLHLLGIQTVERM